jgi:hypothetical protein
MILNNWPNDAKTNFFFSCYHGDDKFFEVKYKMLDNFEEGLEDAGYFDSLK